LFVRAKRYESAEIARHKTNETKECDQPKIKALTKQRDFPNIAKPVDNRHQEYRLHRWEEYHKHRNHKRRSAEAGDCANSSGYER